MPAIAISTRSSPFLICPDPRLVHRAQETLTFKNTPLVFTVLLFAATLTLGSGTASAQTDGAVINKAGVPVKLITTRATQLYAGPDKSGSSAPCPAFKFWYVLPPEKTPSRHISEISSLTKDGFYRVAADDSERAFQGWIAEDDAVEWHHRQAVKFAPKRGRELAHFYPTEDDAVSATSNDDTGQASHREPEAGASDLVLMPLLDVGQVRIAGEEMELYEVAFMAGRPETAPPSASGVTVPGISGEITRERVRKESTIDIVFVVDTTNSMEPVIARVRQSIRSVTRSLASDEELRPRLRFGLVAYRDTVPDMSNMEYLTRVFCTLEEGADHQLFQNRLDQVRQARVGSEGYPEDALAGIAVAMDTSALRWNPLGWKQIVVVGDASMKVADHPDPHGRGNQSGRTIAGIKAEAQPGAGGAGGLESITEGGFVFSAVRVKDPEAAEDHAVGDRHFNDLVAGRTYNGRMISARGGVNPEDFSGELTSAILEAIENFGQAVVRGNGSRPAMKAQTASGAPTGATAADFPWPVLDILDAVGDGESEAEGMRFGHRYSTEFDADGNRIFVPHLFIRKGRLLSFNAMLDFLQGQLEDAGEPGNRDVVTIIKGLQTLSATLNFDEEITPDMPIEKFLALLLGFPLKNPIFERTIGDLAAMSQTDYDDWMKSIKAQKDTLKKITENAHIWRKLHHDAKDREAHAFVALSDLP